MCPTDNNNNDLLLIYKPVTSTSGEAYVSSPSGTYSEGFDFPTKKPTNETKDHTATQYNIFDYAPNIREYLEKDENQSQSRQLNMLLDLIKKVVIGYDPDFPKIRISLASDESVSLSWRVGVAYFGVSLFEDTNESSWSLIQQGPRGYEADGYLNDPDLYIHLSVIFELLNKHHNR